MRTKVTLAVIVMAIVAAVLAAGAAAIVLWGFDGLVVYAAAGLSVVGVYRLAIRPWHLRWGATEEEVSGAMPGDGIIPGAKSTTRAISIEATPAEIWPWIKQLGYGRAGWYSYDWIDNDGKPSADTIVWEHQHLEPGEQILMVPGMGLTVREVVEEKYFVAGDRTMGTWCLSLVREEDTTRLVSRWRQDWKITAASVFWIAITDPGSFVMEQKMLRGIKARAESMRAPSLRR